MSALRNVLLVMAGGQGTRFWPESTVSNPKQYSKIIGDKSLLETTLDRFNKLVESKDRYIVTVKNQEEKAIVNSSGKISENGLIFEPEGRNTAPCILLSLMRLLDLGYRPDDVVLVVPSDHLILDEKRYLQIVKRAIDHASLYQMIVTIGIIPSFPHTGYGYIEKGISIDDDSFKVNSFKEKPSLSIAKDYLISGNYLWNAGMFIAPIKVLLEEFASCAPEIYAYGQDLMEHISNQEKINEIYSNIPSKSIDYAVMERSKRVLVIPGSFGWNDLGSWDALEDVLPKENDNTIVSALDKVIIESKGNIVYTPDKFVALIGVDNLVVISNQRGVVVMDKKKSQEIKTVVEYLKSNSTLKELIK